jgi:hypothetical protein
MAEERGLHKDVSAKVREQVLLAESESSPGWGCSRPGGRGVPIQLPRPEQRSKPTRQAAPENSDPPQLLETYCARVFA